MNNADLGALLENNFLSYVRTVSVFFVAGIALFNFTELGKNFSVIALIVALILLFSIITDYFIERHRIGQEGFRPRIIIDIMAFVLVAIIGLIMWVLYTVWNTTQVSLVEIAKEVETEVQSANKELIKNIQKLEDKIILSNNDLIDTLKQINGQNNSLRYGPELHEKLNRTIKTSKLEVPNTSNIPTGLAQKHTSTVNNALIAAVI